MKTSWSLTRLGDMCQTNISSYTARDAYPFVNYLDTGNITENIISEIQHLDLAETILPSRARRKVKKNDVIFSTVRPNQRHYGFIEETPPYFLVSTGFAVLSPVDKKTNGRFLYYLLSQDHIIEKLQAIGEQSTSAYPSIKPSDIEDLEFYIPSYSEQGKIADTLAALEKRMSLNAQINQNLEAQAQALFQEMFIDNANSSWEIGTINDIGTVKGGSTPSKARPEYYTKRGIAWITPKDLSLGRSKFISHGEIDITELGLKNCSASVMPKGTVLFSSRAPIGYIAIASNAVTTNQGFKSIIPHPHIGTAFVYYFLKYNLSVIEGMASGSTFKEVSGSVMKSIPAQIPDHDTLSRFAGACEPIFEQQEQLEREICKLAELRDFLLPKLMSGEIDVSEVAV